MKNVIPFDFNLLKPYNKIYVLVSGGFDSTYLYELINNYYPSNTYPVNCYNPYEWNKTLQQIKKENPNFIKILPEKVKDIIKRSFKKLPYAYKLKEEKRYCKTIFPCCRVLKHKNFKKDDRFKELNTVIISGIKRGDGKQRRIWLTQLYNNNTFFHLHKTNILYCYPYRDYKEYELPENIKNELWKKYPYLSHSGCILCPILVLFNIYSEGERYEKSLAYARKLNVYPYKELEV